MAIMKSAPNKAEKGTISSVQDEVEGAPNTVELPFAVTVKALPSSTRPPLYVKNQVVIRVCQTEPGERKGNAARIVRIKILGLQESCLISIGCGSEAPCAAVSLNPRHSSKSDPVVGATKIAIGTSVG